MLDFESMCKLFLILMVIFVIFLIDLIELFFDWIWVLFLFLKGKFELKFELKYSVKKY